ncbi:Hypp1520 [Branchiostoma lanceolatum]|uniref:Hypp1520 protein n=1 Tax=Branchiostoma lanceolatum TaxID=7740 RepID=A0A8K0EL90_BRALA|nr:Hypp1520 [Branchiostoma lanceolatum]
MGHFGFGSEQFGFGLGCQAYADQGMTRNAPTNPRPRPCPSSTGYLWGGGAIHTHRRLLLATTCHLSRRRRKPSSRLIPTRRQRHHLTRHLVLFLIRLLYQIRHQFLTRHLFLTRYLLHRLLAHLRRRRQPSRSHRCLSDPADVVDHHNI